MTDTTAFWLSSLLSGAGTGLLGYFGRGWRDDRRKDREEAGNLATDLVKSLMAEVNKLREENAAERAMRDKEHHECELQLRDLRHQIANLIMKIEVLRMRAGVPSAEWLKLESEFTVTPPDLQILAAKAQQRLDDSEPAALDKLK